MPEFRVLQWAAGCIALVMVAAAAPAGATNIDMAMRLTGPASPPFGHVDFCRVHPQECGPHPQADLVVTLNTARWDELVAVNVRVNAEITPMTDMALYGVLERWEFPVDAGDCEDIALLKRQVLIGLGWPPSALLITVVRDERGEGHAVLTARTSIGDLILDNRVNEILPWSSTPYVYIKRQSTRHAAQWDGIADSRGLVMVATTG